ncbi:hypothetical protein [Helicobacter pylori]|uniref:hypothetical protein n=1 Tax=Helicobacter pylori TaxID=210 RepID=UPI000EB2D621
MQTLKNKAFRVSIQWNALVRKLLSLERGTLTGMDEKKSAHVDSNIFQPESLSCWICLIA